MSDSQTPEMPASQASDTGRRVGDVVAVITNAALLYLVFPFDFAAFAYAWTALARVVLVIAMLGSAIAIIVQFVNLIRAAIRIGAASSWPGVNAPDETVRLVGESEEDHESSLEFEHLCPVKVADALADVAAAHGGDLADHGEAC